MRVPEYAAFADKAIWSSLVIIDVPKFRQAFLILFVTCAGSCYAQTVTSPGGTANTVPYFTSGAVLGSSGMSFSNGNFGINNTSPGFALDVNGDINLSGALRYNGSPLILSPGGGNLGVGIYTLSSVANGSLLDTAFGHFTLSANSSGLYDAAFGYLALNLNTSGSFNTALGTFSLKSNTTGSYNIGVGTSSLQDNTTGVANTAFGMSALANNVTGNSNTAFGVNALESSIDSNTNDAVGTEALTGITTGSDNVALGNGAGDDATQNSDPSKNSYDLPVVPNTAAYRNTYLGTSTASLNTGDTNEIVIGAFTTGHGSNSVTLGNIDITSTVLRGNVQLSGNSGASITFPDNTTQGTAWNGTTFGGDYAEAVDVAGERSNYGPGDIIVIDPRTPGTFAKSDKAYSRFVAGVYSTKPGLLGRREMPARLDKEAEVPMAMIGIVPTKVSAENGSIEPGDLLVSAGTPGYAMKGTESPRMTGAVIGKALAAFKAGRGVIEVLVSLQ